ncbi:MAG: lamin tail domain-containing protein [Minisyncoccia bacterium]
MKAWILLLIIFLLFNFCYASNILITEVMYNPEGSDEYREWFEAINLGGDINVKTGKSGWRIFDGKNHILKGEDFLWRNNEIIIFTNSISKFLSEYPNCNAKLVESSFSLANKNETIKIFDENKNQLAEFNYSSDIGGDGNDYTLIYDNGSIRQGNVKKGTPGVYPESNIIEEKKIEKINTTSEATTSYMIKEEQKQQSATQTIEKNKEEFYPETIIITEFLADEKGKDLNEFIELYNYGDEKIDLNNFYLVVGDKNIKLNGFINPGEYKVFYKNDFGFNIRNNGEIIKILNNKDEEVFSIKYNGKARVGKSFSRDEDGNWKWTIPTPGKKNIFKEEIVKEENVKDQSNEDLENFLTPYESFNKSEIRNFPINPIFIGISILILLIIIFIFFIK